MFLTITCTNLDDFQKEGGNFLNLLQKEGGTQKGGGVPTLEETMTKNLAKTHSKLIIKTLELHHCHCPGVIFAHLKDNPHPHASTTKFDKAIAV